MKKKVVCFSLFVILIFSFTTATVTLAAEKGEGKMSIIMEGRTIILVSEDGKITPDLLHGFLISLERLTKTYIFDEYPRIILFHSTAMRGNGTATTNLGVGVFEFYGHFCDGKRDISKKLYR